MLPNTDLVEDGGYPGGHDHVAHDVDAVAVDHQVEPVGAIGRALKTREKLSIYKEKSNFNET